MALTLKSGAYADGDTIPARYTCEGEDISPPLEWSGVPDGARSLVLLIDDPDAPDPRAPRVVWVHWVLFNIPPESAGLAEGASSGDLPQGAAEGLNDWGNAGYGGPCPPIGRHRYVHKLYALDRVLDGLNRPTKAEVLAAMEDHILAVTTLVATYQK
ncbi:MAG: YbhB/YbcL family Raf kinase inhibitor-like protein [Gammaproteobacteria bacterium]